MVSLLWWWEKKYIFPGETITVVIFLEIWLGNVRMLKDRKKPFNKLSLSHLNSTLTNYQWLDFFLAKRTPNIRVLIPVLFFFCWHWANWSLLGKKNLISKRCQRLALLLFHYYLLVCDLRAYLPHQISILCRSQEISKHICQLKNMENMSMFGKRKCMDILQCILKTYFRKIIYCSWYC